MPSSDRLIKLPLFARRKKLPRLPGQPSDTSYVCFSGACPQPDDALCYIGELMRGSRVRILAYISENGFVYPADEPLRGHPDLKPALTIAPINDTGKADEGGIFLITEDGFKRVGDYLGTPARTLRVREDPTDEARGQKHRRRTRALPYQEFMATLFLRYCLPLTKGAPEQQTTSAEDLADIALKPLAEPVEIFAGFRDMALPDAIGTFLYRVDAREQEGEELSGVERYARTVFREFDLDRLRRIASSSEVTLSRIGRTDAFYLNFNHTELSPADVAFLYGVEARLNRISLVLDSLGAGLAPLTASPAQETCSLIEMHTLLNVTSHVPALLARTGEQSPWSTPGTVACEPGGSWNALIRMASFCEGLNLVVRLDYSMRYDASARTMFARFYPSTSDSMPTTRFDGTAGGWVELDQANRAGMAREYTARMALVLAAAAFASGLTINRCVVEQAAFVGIPEQAYSFDRAAYLARWAPLAARVAGTPLASQETERELERQRIPNYHDAGSRALLNPPRRDDRALPGTLRDMLLADNASELEVMENEDDPDMQRVHELQQRTLTDPAGAMEGLTNLIEELQARCVAAELMASQPVTSQYCDNYVARLLMGLQQDNHAMRVLRVPDALYNAQFEFVRTLCRAGRFEDALPEARKLVDMASTSPTAHFALLNVLAQLGRFDDVVDVAKHGMAYAYDREVIAYYLYRLAFAYWNLGDRKLALACYRMMPRGGGMESESEQEVRALMAEMPQDTLPTVPEAAAQLKKAEIPLPPTDRLVEFLFNAAVLLTDHGFLFLASRCVYELWRIMGRDELSAVYKSLTW